jgi:hypothetical protein
MTKREATARLARIEAEYKRVLLGLSGWPEEGNGFCTKEEAKKEAANLYLSTIAVLRKIAGIY